MRNNTLISFSAAFLAAVALSSCNSVIYEDLPLCEARHEVRFIWDHNMDFRDKFQGNVGSVALYGFDKSTDVLAWIVSDKGDHLGADGYTLPLKNLPAGDYNVVAWCGLENDNEDIPDSFLPADMIVGTSKRDDLYCRMERDILDDGSHHSSSQLHDLFHGTTSLRIYGDTEPEGVGNHTYTISLKKDTNRVRILLSSEAGIELDPQAYTYTITESNGLLHHDNSLLDDELITYHPFTKYDASDIIEERPAFTRVAGGKIAADFDISRMLEDRQTNLTITDPTGKKVVDTSLTTLALKVKDNYGRPMDDQEYLDRQDNHTLSFTLASDGIWSGAVIYVNSWRVVLMPDVVFQ